MKMTSINAGAERVQGVKEGKGLNSIHAFWDSPASLSMIFACILEQNLGIGGCSSALR
jgi:hypothetical protein